MKTVSSAAIYARISSDVEGSGMGVARQVDDCQRLAKQLGWVLAEVNQDSAGLGAAVVGGQGIRKGTCKGGACTGVRRHSSRDLPSDRVAGRVPRLEPTATLRSGLLPQNPDLHGNGGLPMGEEPAMALDSVRRMRE